jgi:hypothetical protein
MGRPQAVDLTQDLDEQSSGDSYIRELACDTAAMAHDPHTDLDRLPLQGRERTVLGLLGQHRHHAPPALALNKSVLLSS